MTLFTQVTDARATMAVYRLHRKDWEKGNRPIPLQGESAATAGTKRKRGDGDAAEKEEEGNDGGEVVKPSSTKKEKKKKKKVNSQEYPGGGRKGVSSGLSTVVRHGPGKEKEKTQWWKQLPTVTMPGSKGSVRIGKSTS
jgi:RNA exonuclease 4